MAYFLTKLKTKSETSSSTLQVQFKEISNEDVGQDETLSEVIAVLETNDYNSNIENIVEEVLWTCKLAIICRDSNLFSFFQIKVNFEHFKFCIVVRQNMLNVHLWISMIYVQPLVFISFPKNIEWIKASLRNM